MVRRHAEEGAPGDDAGALEIVVGEFGAERDVRHDIGGEPEAQQQRHGGDIGEERQAREADRHGEQHAEADEHRGEAREHEEMAAAPARLRVVGDRADEGIHEGVDRERDEQRGTGQRAGKTANGGEVEEQERCECGAADAVDELPGTVDCLGGERKLAGDHGCRTWLRSLPGNRGRGAWGTGRWAASGTNRRRRRCRPAAAGTGDPCGCASRAPGW